MPRIHAAILPHIHPQHHVENPDCSVDINTSILLHLNERLSSLVPVETSSSMNKEDIMKALSETGLVKVF